MRGIGCQIFDDPHDVDLAGEYLTPRNSGSIDSERLRPPKLLGDRKYPFVHVDELKRSINVRLSRTIEVKQLVRNIL